MPTNTTINSRGECGPGKILLTPQACCEIPGEKGVRMRKKGERRLSRSLVPGFQNGEREGKTLIQNLRYLPEKAYDSFLPNELQFYNNSFNFKKPKGLKVLFSPP